MGSRGIRCDRSSSNEANCTLKNTHFLGLLTKSTTLPKVKQAILNTTTDTNDKGKKVTTYGLSLQYKGGIQEVNSGLGFFGSNVSKQNFEQINTFLKSNQPNIELNRSTTSDFDGYFITFGTVIFMGFIIYLVSYFLLDTAKSQVLIKWNFDRSLDLLTKEGFTFFGIFQKKGTKTEYVLANIKGIEIRNSQNFDDDESSPQYSLFLTFHEPVDALTSMRIDIAYSN